MNNVVSTDASTMGQFKLSCLCGAAAQRTLLVVSLLTLCLISSQAYSDDLALESNVLRHASRSFGEVEVTDREKTLDLIAREMAHEVAKRLSLEVTHIDCPLARCVNLLRSGSADLMMFVNAAHQFNQSIEFIQIWPNSMDIIFIVHSEKAQEITEYTDLYGLRLGVVTGYKYFRQMDEDNLLNLTSVISPLQLPKMLMADRIDAYITYIPFLASTLVKYPNFAAAKYTQKYNDLAFIAISKSSPLLSRSSEINAIALELIKDGTFDEIMERHLPNEPKPYPKHLKN